MAFVLADRVKETASAPGTGTVTLLGAVTGYQSFSAGVGASNTTYYTIADQSGSNWEVGYGTIGAGGTTLARTTVLSSSNSGSLVNFSSGTQDVWCDYTAKKAAIQDSIGTTTVPQLATNSTTSTTPVLSFNASNSNYAAGATISGSYLQTLLQNKSGTAGASTNYVLSNDLGTDSSYYGEFGMNSSVYSASTPSDFYSINNGIYFSGHDGDITVGSGNGYKTYMAWGTTGQSAHVINASGALGLSTNLGTTPATSGTTGYGTSGQALVSAGSSAAPAWGTLGVSGGGTSQTTYTTGDILYASASNTLSKLAVGTTGQVLTVASGVPSWAAASGGGATITGTTTTGTYYVVGTTSTSGSLSTASISNTNVVSYNANTGALSAVSHVSSSDERLKKDWKDVASDFIAKLAKVKHGIFTRISSGNTEPGVSAQSLQTILPEAVIEGENGMLTVNYGGAALVAAIELAKEVQALRAEIELLKAK